MRSYARPTVIILGSLTVALAGMPLRAVAEDRPPTAIEQCKPGEKRYGDFTAARQAMELAAQRNIYVEIDKQFSIMVANQVAGAELCTIKATEFTTAGLAALKIGDPGKARARYQSAGSAGAADLAVIDKSFGSARVDQLKKTDGHYPDLTASIAVDPPKLDTWAPTGSREAFDAARAKVAADGHWIGWLPIGTYSVDRKTLKVVAGGGQAVPR
jgi:hypothetical protein